MIAFAVAALLAGGFTYVVYQRLQPAGGEPTKVSKILAAAHDLRPGVALRAEDLVLIDWPEDVPLTGKIDKAEPAVGRSLIIPIGERRPILDRDLAAPGSGYGLSVKIPLGMRATAVRSNEIVGVAGFLFPGSHVDVLATYALPDNKGILTQTVLQDVEVLTTGTATEPDPQGKPQTVSVVTLLLNPEDSQKLLMTSTQGTIQFVLRSGVDQEKVAVPPTRLEQLTSVIRPPALVETRPVSRPAPKPSVAAPPPPPPPVEAPKLPAPKHHLEMIQGTQRSVKEFDATQQ